MSKLVWDQDTERLYETGVSHGVLYVKNDQGAYGKGVAWNGLTAVNESPTGGEITSIYADNIKYLQLVSVEEFEATIEAYTYPDEFAVCDGSVALATGFTAGQQKRVGFGFCYRTEIGNDVSSEYGYKLHLVYGAMAQPSDKSHETVNDNPEAETFSWEIKTVPIAVNLAGVKPSAHFVLDSTKIAAGKLAAIEDRIYGTTLADPTLLTPEEIVAILNDATTYTVTVGTVTNGTSSGNTTASAYGTATVQYTPSAGYTFPTSVSVTGSATAAYDPATGTLSLSNIQSDVTVAAVVCPEVTD